MVSPARRWIETTSGRGLVVRPLHMVVPDNFHDGVTCSPLESFRTMVSNTTAFSGSCEH